GRATIPAVGWGNTGEASTDTLPRLDRLKIPTHTATWSKFCVQAMWRSPTGVPAWLASVLANTRRSPGEGPGAPRSTYCCRGGLWITTSVSPGRVPVEADVIPTPIVATIAVAKATVPTAVMSFRRISLPFSFWSCGVARLWAIGWLRVGETLAGLGCGAYGRPGR